MNTSAGHGQRHFETLVTGEPAIYDVLLLGDVPDEVLEETARHLPAILAALVRVHRLIGRSLIR